MIEHLVTYDPLTPQPEPKERKRDRVSSDTRAAHKGGQRGKLSGGPTAGWGPWRPAMLLINLVHVLPLRIKTSKINFILLL